MLESYPIHPEIPNFTWIQGGDRILCPMTGIGKPSKRFFGHMELLQKLREWYAAPIAITSGWRSSVYNDLPHIQGIEDSQHLVLPHNDDDRFATDVVGSLRSTQVPARMSNQPAANEMLARRAVRIGFHAIGIYDSHVHLDMRDLPPGRTVIIWDERTGPLPFTSIAEEINGR